MSVAVILAAGLGTRMKSAAPKAAQRIGGRAMLTHLTMAAAGMFDRLVVVVGPDMPGLAALAAPHEVVVQAERLGTGHAALMAASAFGDDLVGIFYADNPLLTPATMEALRTRAAAGDAGLVVLGMRPAVAGAYGRLVMEDGFLARIVEAAEATDDELAIGLCNAGGFIAAAADLRRWLAALRPANAKGEYYLTDIVAAARAEGARVAVHEAPAEECLGVNSRAELAAAEAVFQARARTAALSAGVAMLAPETVFFSADTELAADVVIGPYVVFGPGVRIGAGAEIKPFSHWKTAWWASPRPSAPTPACAPAPISALARMSAISAKSRPPHSGPAPRSTICPISATPKSAPAPTSAPAPSPAITTAKPSTAPPSAPTPSSARTPHSWRRSRWGTARASRRARSSPMTCRMTHWPSAARGRW
jgi:UDP-N-acetylglucosamine diphosphorylase/glucosamine-1-phosphate N-acetyltransferase